MRELELYVHIPFCIKKCLYCDFLSAPANPLVRDRYMKRLTDEIRVYAPDFRDCRVSSIYIGGGTPSISEPEQIEKLMDTLHGHFSVAEDAEISIECNPGTLTGEKVAAMRRTGINRISIGLQSADDDELKSLGRIHTYAEFKQGYACLKEAGFSNINVDIMSGLPGQSVKSWEKTLQSVADLYPEHISAYSLIIEEGTPFFSRYLEDELARERGDRPVFLPSEEEDRLMYELTGEFLTARGYHRYEISNYALPGYECRHNIGYWTGKEYLGLGLGASSLIGNVRFRNTDIFEDYMTPSGNGVSRTEKPFVRHEEERLGRKEEMEEFMFLGLRMTRGISRHDFRERFGVMPEAVYGDILKGLEDEGLVERSGGRIFLTKRGIDVSNMVFIKFLL